MYTRLAFALGLIALYLFCAEAQNPQCVSQGSPGLYVQCAKMKCSDGNRCECGCGSWCGYDTTAFTNDTLPRCQIERKTPDVPENRTIPGNPCETSNCPFKPVQIFICPPGGKVYNYTGASCDRDTTTKACYWSLPECDPILPPVGTTCNTCSGPQPASGPICLDSWPLNQIRSGYVCEHDGSGKCVWTQKSCPSSGCPTGVQNPRNCGVDKCLQFQQGELNFPSCPAPGTAGLLCENIFCGGCNFKLTLNGQDVCPESYRTPEAITCNFGHTKSPNYPYCINDQTCETTTCASGEKCEYVWQFNGVAQYRPQCVKYGAPKPSEYNCTNVVCSNGYTCQNQPGSNPGFVCSPQTAACAAADCQNIAKKACLDTATANSLTCQRKKNGLCDWSFAPCPDYVSSSPTDCKVTTWSDWFCSGPRDQWTKAYRNRTITQQPSGGKACPILFEIGDDCQGGASNGVGKTALVINPTNVTFAVPGPNPGVLGSLLSGSSTPTPTNTPTGTPTNTPTGTPTNTPTGTPTGTPTNTPTSTPTGTPTNTPTGTPTNTPTGTPTNTPTGTPTNTPTGTPTNTPTGTPTRTPTNTPTGTPTRTPSSTPTGTPSSTPSGTPTQGSPSGSPTPGTSGAPGGNIGNTDGSSGGFNWTIFGIVLGVVIFVIVVIVIIVIVVKSRAGSEVA